jgi:hypothetical protein
MANVSRGRASTPPRSSGGVQRVESPAAEAGSGAPTRRRTPPRSSGGVQRVESPAAEAGSGAPTRRSQGTSQLQDLSDGQPESGDGGAYLMNWRRTSYAYSPELRRGARMANVSRRHASIPPRSSGGVQRVEGPAAEAGSGAPTGRRPRKSQLQSLSK